jgi:hypothetical protein
MTGAARSTGPETAFPADPQTGRALRQSAAPVTDAALIRHAALVWAAKALSTSVPVRWLV